VNSRLVKTTFSQHPSHPRKRTPRLFPYFQQDQTPKLTPDQTPDQTPKLTQEDQTEDQTPDQTPKLRQEDQTPKLRQGDQTGDQTSKLRQEDQTEDQTQDQTPEKTPKQNETTLSNNEISLIVMSGDSTMRSQAIHLYSKFRQYIPGVVVDFFPIAGGHAQYPKSMPTLFSTCTHVTDLLASYMLSGITIRKIVVDLNFGILHLMHVHPHRPWELRNSSRLYVKAFHYADFNGFFNLENWYDTYVLCYFYCYHWCMYMYMCVCVCVL
jgi:hypothetical protein